MTILDFLRNNPGKHTAKTIADATGYAENVVMWILAPCRRKPCSGVTCHEQHGKIVYEHKEPNA